MKPVAGLAAALLAATGITACGSGSNPAPAARAFLAAWSRGDDAAAAAATDHPDLARKALTQLRSGLDLSGLHASVTSVSGGGSRATVHYTARMQLRGLGGWTYRGTLALRSAGGHWTVRWQPADLYPTLRPGQHLGRERTLPPRAPILDAAGDPLFTPTPTVTVGVEPSRLGPTTLAQLAAATGIDPASAAAAAQAASPTAFVPLITLRRADYDKVRARIHDLPGAVFQTGVEDLPPTPTFARAVLGQVGPATKEVLAAAGSNYLPSDRLGLYGLQARYQQRLAGTASGAVVVLDSAGRPVATLHRFAGTPGTPVRTTLDRSMQLAAEQALAGVGKPAALVAIRPSDGALLAVANAPAEDAYDRALVGRYPPGSTFKVVTTYALLGLGVQPTDPVPCPPQVNVDGKVFHNFEGEAPGAVTFRTDFAISCNTAFLGLATQRHPDLRAAADAFGIGGSWQLPLATYTGSVPVPASPVEAAADAIGQGRVLVSPLDLALVAAAVESGQWRAPTLVPDPAPSSGATRPLDPARIATLRSLMQSVVSSGTATGAGLPAGTAGKTGTAEFGTGPKPATHAWFIGYHGDLAFAIIVEGGGVGGQVAAPIAATFLHALGQ